MERKLFDKYKVMLVISLVLLLVTTLLLISQLNEKREQEEKQLARDVRASYTVMNSLNRELQRYMNMYDRGDVNDITLEEHNRVLTGICNTVMKIRYATRLTDVRLIIPISLDEVNAESYYRYKKLSEYLMSIFEDRPETEEYEGEEVDYFYKIYTSDEYKNSIESILNDN